MKVPYLYQKIRAFIEHAETRQSERDQFREDLARRFRITSEDMPKIISEMESYGMIKSKTQRKIRFK